MYVLVVAAVALSAVAEARVERVDVVSRADYQSARSFGGATYERITLRVHYVLDPKDPHDRMIVDLDRAPKNAAGLVEATGDVDILRPKQGSDVMIVNIPNRGDRLYIRDDIKDDWYLRQGFTIAEVAWQFDVRPDPRLLHFVAPVAKGIRGPVRVDFVVAENVAEHPLGHVIGGELGGLGYPVADAKTATLTERDAPLAQRHTIAQKRWRFTDDHTVHFDDHFVPGKIYEVIYTGADPAVVGSGLAAVRDFVSYCKTDPNAIVHARLAYGVGISQTGRLLRQLLFQGFNADRAGKQVFDALLVFVAGAGRGDSFNRRFGQPSRDAQPLSPALYPVDLFPFTDEPTRDPVTGANVGLLDRAKAEKVVPKIFYVNTAYEYWSRGGSLVHTTPDGTRDVAPPATTRIYMLAGYSHVGPAFPPTDPQRALKSQYLINPNNMMLLRHGFVAALDAWVRNGVEPPASRYPRLVDKTLVTPAAVKIDGVTVPKFAYEPYRLASTTEPPHVSGTFTSLVPAVDADGNDVAGVRGPEIEVPIATYTGWNLRHPDVGFPDYRTSFLGAFIPFAKAKVTVRYRDADTYVGKIAASALGLVDQRFFIAEDLQYLLRHARATYDYVMR